MAKKGSQASTKRRPPKSPAPKTPSRKTAPHPPLKRAETLTDREWEAFRIVQRNLKDDHVSRSQMRRGDRMLQRRLSVLMRGLQTGIPSVWFHKSRTVPETLRKARELMGSEAFFEAMVPLLRMTQGKTSGKVDRPKWSSLVVTSLALLFAALETGWDECN